MMFLDLTSLLLLFNTALVTAVSASPSQRDTAKPCPIIKNTKSGFILTVNSTKSILNGRTIGTRLNQNDPSFDYPLGTHDYMSVDVVSDTVLLNLENGVLRNYTTGPDGSLVATKKFERISLNQAVDGTSYYLPGLSTTEYDPIDAGWYLTDSGDGKTYNLRHNSTADAHQGWIMGLADYGENYGPWYSAGWYYYPANATRSEPIEFGYKYYYIEVQAKLTEKDQLC